MEDNADINIARSIAGGEDTTHPEAPTAFT